MSGRSRFAALLSAVVLLVRPVAVAAAGPARDNGTASFLKARGPALLREYMALLSIPDIASDAVNIRRNAEVVKIMLEKRGVEARLLESPGAPPVVFGEMRLAGAKKTVVFYAHYDGQPVDPSEWNDGPWTPVLRDGRLEDGGPAVEPEKADLFGTGHDYRLYARASSDDKAPIMALMAALDILKAAGRPVSVNIKFIFEGEEEAGSPHLQAVLNGNRDLLKADALFICDGPVDQSGRMQLCFGARGTMGLEMTVYGPNHALHSGHYGNWAPNPAAVLAGLLAGMRAENGKVLVDGFYKDVRPATKAERKAVDAMPDVDARLRREYGLAATEAGNSRLAERLLLPGFNIRGIKSGAVGSGAANAVPPDARASIDIRLVPDQTPAGVREAVEAHIGAKGFHIIRKDPTAQERLSWPKLIKIEWENGYPPYRLALDHPFGRAAAAVLVGSLPEPPLMVPGLGGSVPMRMFADTLGLPVVVLPIANYDNNQHGPNENLRLKNLWDGTAMFAALLEGLGRSW